MANRCRTTWLLVTFVVIALLAACGGGEDEDSLPKDVVELQAAFSTAPVFLHDYFVEIKDGGSSSNPDTVMTREDVSKPYSYDAYSLQIQYKGATIYDEEITKGFPVAAHGFTSSGEYIIVVNRLYSNSTYASLFVNGQKADRLETGLHKTDFGSIRDIGNGWLVLVTEYSYGDCVWKLYNLRTHEFRDYGFAACPKNFEP